MSGVRATVSGVGTVQFASAATYLPFGPMDALTYGQQDLYQQDRDQNRMENKDLARHWIELQRILSNSSEMKDLEWIIVDVGHLLHRNPDKCFDFILEVLQQTDDEWVLTNLAAGPLESLLSHYPQKGLELVTNEIGHNTKLKEILSGVWQNLMPDETWRRLQKLRD